MNAFAFLLLATGIPRVVYWLFEERPFDMDGVIAQLGIVIALMILIFRDKSQRAATAS